MSIASVKNKSPSAKPPRLHRQISQAKAILRQLRDTLEDLDDRRDLSRAKKRNQGKPGTDWETVKKESASSSDLMSKCANPDRRFATLILTVAPLLILASALLADIDPEVQKAPIWDCAGEHTTNLVWRVKLGGESGLGGGKRPARSFRWKDSRGHELPVARSSWRETPRRLGGHDVL